MRGAREHCACVPEVLDGILKHAQAPHESGTCEEYGWHVWPAGKVQKHALQQHVGSLIGPETVWLFHLTGTCVNNSFRGTPLCLSLSISSPNVRPCSFKPHVGCVCILSVHECLLVGFMDAGDVCGCLGEAPDAVLGACNLAVHAAIVRLHLGQVVEQPQPRSIAIDHLGHTARLALCLRLNVLPPPPCTLCQPGLLLLLCVGTPHTCIQLLSSACACSSPHALAL